MPLLLLVGAGAGLGGFLAGRGASGVGTTVKWAVIGAGGYIIAKHAKII